DFDLGAVHHRVALALPALVVDHGDGTLAVHDHQIAGLGLDRLNADEAHAAVGLGVQARLFGHSRCRTTDVEGTHGELRSRFADGLRRDNSRGLAQFDQTSGGEITSIAHNADA